MFLLGIHEHVWTKTLRYHSTWKQSCNSLALMGLFFRPRCASINQSRLVIANVYTNSASKRCCMIAIFPIGEMVYSATWDVGVWKSGEHTAANGYLSFVVGWMSISSSKLCINLKCPWADCELKDSSISNSSKRISCSVRQMLSPETIFQAFQFFAALGSNSSGGAYLRGFDGLWSISRQRSCRKWSKFDHSTGI